MGTSWLLSRVRGADRLLLGSGLLAALSVLLFAAELIRPVVPGGLLWAPTPIGCVLLVAIYRRTARTESLPVPVRRFWQHLVVVAGLVGLAATAQAVDVLRHPGVPGENVTSLNSVSGSPCASPRRIASEKLNRPRSVQPSICRRA